MAVQLTDSNFKSTVLDTNKVAIVDFWAEWCGPCKAIGPMIEEISKEFEGKAVVGKVDVDNNPETTMKYGIRNIPTILFIKNGQVVDKQIGAVPKSNLVAMLNKHLS
jgi:thioredoxin 1